ncbi:unnamed protein product, partial [Scytosiphon promiscuus]
TAPAGGGPRGRGEGARPPTLAAGGRRVTMCGDPPRDRGGFERRGSTAARNARARFSGASVSRSATAPPVCGGVSLAVGVSVISGAAAARGGKGSVDVGNCLPDEAKTGKRA